MSFGGRQRRYQRSAKRSSTSERNDFPRTLSRQLEYFRWGGYKKAPQKELFWGGLVKIARADRNPCYRVCPFSHLPCKANGCVVARR